MKRQRAGQGRSTPVKLVKSASRQVFLGAKQRASVIEGRPDRRRERRQAKLALRRDDETTGGEA